LKRNGERDGEAEEIMVREIKFVRRAPWESGAPDYFFGVGPREGRNLSTVWQAEPVVRGGSNHDSRNHQYGTTEGPYISIGKRDWKVTVIPERQRKEGLAALRARRNDPD